MENVGEYRKSLKPSVQLCCNHPGEQPFRQVPFMISQVSLLIQLPQSDIQSTPNVLSSQAIGEKE